METVGTEEIIYGVIIIGFALADYCISMRIFKRKFGENK